MLNSDTNCDLKFFSFPRNPQRYDLVIIDVHAGTELYFIVHKTLSYELKIYHDNYLV